MAEGVARDPDRTSVNEPRATGRCERVSGWAVLQASKAQRCYGSASIVIAGDDTV